MNTKEKKLVALLKTMASRYGVLGVKAEFEAEGTRVEELLRLKDIASQAQVGLALKIGGAEDVWGILQARRVGVSEIVAPMIESAYALQKFLEAFKKHVPEDEREEVIAAVNIETAKSYKDIDRILDIGVSGNLHGVTVGRVDLVGSMGLERKDINSPKIFEMTKAVCEKAKKLGMRTVMGGGIESASREFVEKLVAKNLLDRFETRKIIFDAKSAIADYESAVLDAHRFELGWLENKRAHYKSMATEDDGRIPMLKERVNGSKKKG